MNEPTNSKPWGKNRAYNFDQQPSAGLHALTPTQRKNAVASNKAQKAEKAEKPPPPPIRWDRQIKRFKAMMKDLGYEDQ